LAKKRLISSFLLCAFAVLFAHSIIPHHHHEEATFMQHGDHDDDDHNDIDHNFLGKAFSHFQHESGSTITYETASSSFQGSKFSVDKDAIFFTQYVISQIFKPPIIYGEHSLFALICSPFLNTSLFRGPPVAMA
jgi:hypothetical protein